MGMQGVAPDMAPPVLSEVLFFPLPAVDLVERSGSGPSPSASARVAMQGEASDMPPPVLSENNFLSVFRWSVLSSVRFPVSVS